MILGKFFGAVAAQFNKLGNWLFNKDPIAQMQYEYDKAVEQLKEGRVGLEQYRGLVERVTRQVKDGEARVAKLTSQAKAYLKMGDRDKASMVALSLTKEKTTLAENQAQLGMHEQAYENNLKKIQFANKKLGELKDKIHKYDADLKMSEAEAEVAKLTATFNMDLTTNFGQMEDAIQRKIDANRGKARVAADMSKQGMDVIEGDERLEKQMAEDALGQLEVELGMRAPETTPVQQAQKDLGPADAEAARKELENLEKA